jgi:acyl-CoA thioesterase YciA
MIDNIKESIRENLNNLVKNVQYTSVENASKLFAISQRFLTDSNLLNDSLAIKWLERNRKPKSFQRNEECTLIHRYIVMPMDLNPHGTLFGGKMLELLDTAGSMLLLSTFKTTNFVTVEMQNVFFLSSPKLGDLLNFYAEIIELKKASVWIRLVALNETVGGESKRVIDSEIRFAFMDKIKR